jgi:uncharacterized protein (TIGR02246 family)
MKASITALVWVLVAVAAPPLQAGDLQADLLAREKASWTAWGNRDGAASTQGMTEDIVQVIAGIGRTVGKQAVAAATSGHDCVMNSFEFHDAQLRQITPDVAILSFRATQDTNCGGQALPSSVHATSVYVRRDGDWLVTSYQETPAD